MYQFCYATNPISKDSQASATLQSRSYSPENCAKYSEYLAISNNLRREKLKLN